MASPATPSASSPRVIRVFVSSTFLDMREEREELTKQVFPRLRKLCESRGVSWGEVDLRWGVTDEQKADGLVLPICLAQIRRCRPYFIGLLGERYGWVPDSLPPGEVASEPWLAAHKGRSVTELEILHGVLNDPAMATNAFFYLRDPAFVQTLPEWTRPEFMESAAPEDIKDFGEAEAARRVAERREKLARLKDRIRTSGLPVREDYPNPRDLGRLVLEDLTRLIDTLFPEGEVLDILKREALGHEAFLQTRTRVYIGRAAEYEVLDRHVESSGPPLIVTGEAGGGKSALLANWVQRYRKSHPTLPVITHFVGATSSSLGEAALLRRLATELDRSFDLALQIPENPGEMRGVFSQVLSMAASRGRAVLVIDGLQLLEGKSGPADASWLPEEIPPEIRIILSCPPDPVFESLDRRGWPSYDVAQLSADERRDLIREYLAHFAKTLGPRHLEMIVACEHSSNPLFLRTLLEELRLFGSHEELEKRLAHYLTAPSIPMLFSLVLERYEEDYERDRPDLVCDAFSLLYCARRGLAEAELLDLLGTESSPLPQAIWSPLFLAAEASLIDRGGVLSFAHAHIHPAILRYLPWPSSPRAIHRRLAEYFRTREIGPRKLEELPYQLYMDSDLDGLRDVLADLPFLKTMAEADLPGTAMLWEHLESEGYDFFDTYRKVFENPFDYTEYLDAIFLMIDALDHLPQALTFGDLLAAWMRVTEDIEGMAIALNNQGTLLFRLSEFERAQTTYEEAEARSRQAGNAAQVGRALGGRASVLSRMGDLNLSLSLCREAEKIFRDIHDRERLADVLLQQGVILRTRGDLDGAWPLFKEAESIGRETGNVRVLIVALTDVGDALRMRRDLDGAEKALAEIEALFKRGVPGYQQVASLLSIKGVLQQERGHRDEALRQFRLMEELGREQEDRRIETEAKRHTAGLLYRDKEFAAALPLYQEIEKAARDIKDRQMLLGGLSGQAKCRHALKDVEEAARLYSEAEHLCRDDLPIEIVEILGDHASLLYRAGRVNEALALWRRQESLVRDLADPKLSVADLQERADCALSNSEWAQAEKLAVELERRSRESDDVEALFAYLSARARLLYHDRDYGKSLALYERIETLARDRNERGRLGESLEGRGLCYHHLEENDRALSALVEAEKIMRELGRWDRLIDTLECRGRILQNSGQFEESLEVFRELAEIGRKPGQEAVLRIARIAQFVSLFELKRVEEADAALSEAERLCRQAGDNANLRIVLANRASLLMSRGQQDKALPFLGEAAVLARAAGETADLIKMLRRQTEILWNVGRTVEARAILKEREAVCRGAGEAKALADTLLMRAWDIAENGDGPGAIVLYAEVEEISRRIEDMDTLRDTLLYRAECHSKLGQLAEAAIFSEQAENLDRAAGRKDRLQVALDFRAGILWMAGKHLEAARMYEEQEKILREAGGGALLGRCLAKQAGLHMLLGNTALARPLYEEAERVARDAGDAATLSDVLGGLSDLLLGLSAWDDALSALARVERAARERSDQRALWRALFIQANTLFYRKRSGAEALTKVEELLGLPPEASPDDTFRNHAVTMRKQILDLLGRRR
jgi:tetratricopeptide (TPR) repeat protein